MHNLEILCRIINSEGKQTIIFINSEDEYYIIDVGARKHNHNLVNYIKLAYDEVCDILISAKEYLYLNIDLLVANDCICYVEDSL